ncbi:MAG: signal transduction histidine kinase [Cryomorphaceae bacterium]|jgi:signal transduction histidine kinase
MNLIEAFRKNETFQNVDDKHLQFLVDHGEVRKYKKGEYIFNVGDAADELLYILNGRFRLIFTQNGEQREIAMMTQYDISGVLPYSRMTHAQGAAECREEAALFAIDRKHFREMIVSHEPLAEALVHHMASRIRSFTQLRMQDEKLISLGKLSAGLAHELNNPASAMVRSSEELVKHLKLLPDGFKQVMKSNLDPDTVDKVNDWLFAILENERPSLTLMQRNDREDELSDLLEEYGLEDPYELSEECVDYGLCRDDVESLHQLTGEGDFHTVIHWVVNNLSTERMVEEIHTSAERISTLIGSIKEYSHMDRSQDRQDVDINAGLKSTITMLRHKAKNAQIEVEEAYCSSIPHLSGFAGELNQVWTNIIDNALDAMDGGGRLTIRTDWIEPNVCIKIADTGSGIPDDIQSQIFDPFFTTKSIGKGTGLGLDIVNKIISRHNGRIELKSKPGNTEFTITLPAVEPI